MIRMIDWFNHLIDQVEKLVLPMSTLKHNRDNGMRCAIDRYFNSSKFSRNIHPLQAQVAGAGKNSTDKMWYNTIYDIKH